MNIDDKKFGRALFTLFDRQRFEDDPRLAELIWETDVRCEGNALSDELLEQVSAAGGKLQRMETKTFDSGTDLTPEDEMRKDSVIFDPYL